MSSIRERVIVLRSIRFGDADLILHCLNSNGAKSSLIAKSALKSQRRFGGGILEPTHYLEILLKPAGGRGSHATAMPVLLEARLLESFDGIRHEYQKLELAFYFLQLIAKISQEGGEDRELFHLLGNGLRAIQSTSRVEVLKLHFEIKILAHQGVLPHLYDIDKFATSSILDHQELKIDSEQIGSLRSACGRLLDDYLG